VELTVADTSDDGRRRWLRGSLRLMLAVVGAGALLAWPG
jgi:hypothetical protein